MSPNITDVMPIVFRITRILFKVLTNIIKCHNLSQSVTIYQPRVTQKRDSKPMNGKQQRQRCYSLLPTRQIVHGSESLARSHTVVIDSVQVGLLGVLGTQKCLGALVLGECLDAGRGDGI